ncbi:MAG: phosphonate metabolism protein/1,5-bisphosphokinase (PRPP-forming) PhnN [Acetobacteraceae bacterium]
METSGVLVLVVGPSGAGKDTLLDAAGNILRDDRRFRFVRRVITRPAEAGGESHEAVTRAEFDERRFALAWEAHGLCYGIPDDIGADLAAGRVVIANVSRGVIADAATRFAVRVIEVTAPPETLSARLASRGREDAAGRTARLARRMEMADGVPVQTVLNDATPETGTARFIAALSRAAEGASPSGTAGRAPSG